MESQDSLLKSRRQHGYHMRLILTLACIFSLIGVSACGNGSKGSEASVERSETRIDEYHADNDIAMTVKSLADALRVGEPLDSTQYDFEGVLTDGQGSPLYTDVQGSPGEWQIDVINSTKVMIRNLYLGDLLPVDLETYLLASLGISEADMVEHNDSSIDNDDDTDVRIYHFGGGYMRFEIRAGISPNGLEGPLLNIVLSTDAPSEASA